MAKIELPEGWAGVAEPLRALMAEVDRETHASSTMTPDLAAVSARWAQVSDAIRAAVRARIADAQVASQAPIADRGMLLVFVLGLPIGMGNASGRSSNRRGWVDHGWCWHIPSIGRCLDHHGPLSIHLGCRSSSSLAAVGNAARRGAPAHRCS